MANGSGADLVNNIEQHILEMITEKIGVREVKRLDDIDELVVDNYNLFNTFALYDAEVGSEMKDVLRHFQKTDYYLATNRHEEAVQARNNLNICFYNIFQNNNFPALQWAALIHSVDGKENKDLSVDNLKIILKDLSEQGLTQAKVKADVEAAKKKSEHN